MTGCIMTDSLVEKTPKFGDFFPAEQSELFVRVEQDFLREQFCKNKDEIWTGLALSGGGVRSATFCLGALQAFDECKVLDRFDYQSTVSGGGFMGLSWLWLRRLGGGTAFPFPSEDASGATGTQSASDHTRGPERSSQDSSGNPAISFLRRNIGYLNPSSDINYVSGAVAIIRTIFLNLMVWIPAITLLFLLVAYVELNAIRMGWPYSWTLVVTKTIPSLSIYEKFPVFFALLIVGFLIVVIAAAVSVTASLSLGRLSDWVSQNRLVKAGILLVGALAMASALQTLITQFNSSTSTDKAFVAAGISLVLVICLSILLPREREYLALRKLDALASVWGLWAMALIAVGATPLIAGLALSYANGASTGIVALASLVYGIITAIYSHYVSFRNFAPGLASKVVIVSGAALFLFGLFLLCFYLGESMVPWLEGTSNLQTDLRPLFSDLTRPEGRAVYETVVIAAFMIATFSMFFTNINQIGLHRYYRDRIAETFFPGTRALEDGVSEEAVKGMSITIDKLVGRADNKLQKPYPIINMNAIMVDDTDAKVRLRGGANFIVSPAYAGSEATGWIQTSAYVDPSIGRPLYVATMVAVSGAAVNSSAGYAGTGITRNRIVSVAMRLLNIRLGYWLINPSWIQSKQKKRKAMTKTVPTHFRPGLVHLVSRNWRRGAKFVELSDGGHFDNLGVYELLRRRCRVIVVCDGEADKDTAYAGLVSAARRAREDFGVKLEFEPGMGPERMVPRHELGYPSNSKGAKSPYMVARITYPGQAPKKDEFGVIIYVKSTMIDDVSFVTKGYKGSNPDFPHQSTVDQFFQAEQFEAYRELGYVSARRCMMELDAFRSFANPDALWGTYLCQKKA